MKKKRARQLTHVMSLRVSKELKQHIAQYAKQHNLSISDAVKSLIKIYLDKEEHEQATR